MSVEEHRAHAADRKAVVQVVVVSSTRTVDDDVSGVLITELLETAGHTVSNRRVVDDDIVAIRRVVGEIAIDGETNVAVFTGGTGISRRDVTPEALEPLFERPIPGFGEIFRALSFQEVGAAALLSRASAGMAGPLLIFALPGSENACRLALEKLVIPELSHLLHELDKEGAALDLALDDEDEDEDDEYDDSAEEEHFVDADFDDDDEEAAEEEEQPPPQPSGALGSLGRSSFRVLSEEVVHTDRPGADVEEQVPTTGWKRGIWEIEGEVISGAREELPWELEKISPVVDVLHTAGQVAVLKLPSGAKYSLFGWPDLQRPGSKVIAIGWGQPLAEVIALHRYPTLTGTCIEEDRGFLPSRSADVAETCEVVTGRIPPDTTGELFAVSGDTVWIQRGSKVIKWDGKKEFNDGNPKQVLASLILHWSNR